MSGLSWTTDQLTRLRTIVLSGASDTEAAALLGITPRTCKRHRLRLGLRLPRSGGRKGPRRHQVVKTKPAEPTSEPNTRRWQLGDVVILDTDGKTGGDLMIVVGYNQCGDVVTVYQGEGRRRNPEFYTHELARLHDPKRFGIEVVK